MTQPKWMPKNPYNLAEQHNAFEYGCLMTAHKMLAEIEKHGCLAMGNRFIVNKNFWQQLKREVEEK